MVYSNLSNGAIATNNFRVQTNGDAEFKGSIQATGGTLAGGGWRIVGYNIMGGGYGSVTSTTGWPNANITLDSDNARIVIRETTSETAGVNRVTLGNLS